MPPTPQEQRTAAEGQRLRAAPKGSASEQRQKAVPAGSAQGQRLRAALKGSACGQRPGEVRWCVGSLVRSGAFWEHSGAFGAFGDCSGASEEQSGAF